METALTILFVFVAFYSRGNSMPQKAANFTLPPIWGGNGIQEGDSSWEGVAVESVPVHPFRPLTVDCSESATSLCNQAAWTDFGLGLSGILPKHNLCLKYSPASSCVSKSLGQCMGFLNPATKAMLISFGRIVVSWCYDGGRTLAEMKGHAECYSIAIFDSITSHGCLSQIQTPRALASSVANSIHTGMDLQHLLSNFLGGYQSSTIACLHGAIEEACGKEAADLSLGPALDELKSSSKPKPSQKLNKPKPNNAGPIEPEAAKSQLLNGAFTIYSCFHTVLFCVMVLSEISKIM